MWWSSPDVQLSECFGDICAYIGFLATNDLIVSTCSEQRTIAIDDGEILVPLLVSYRD
jgi:hypothetical protein